MLIQFDSNNVINVDRIDTVYKTGDKTLLVYMGDKTIRLNMTLKEFMTKANPDPLECLTDAYG